MRLVHVPLARADARGQTVQSSAVSGPTVRAMDTGQHVIVVVLTLIGAIRAVSDGVSWPMVFVASAAILAWHTAGTVLAPKSRTQRWAVWLLGFAAIWVAAVAVSAEFVWLAFLLWLLAGHLLPLLWGLVFSGGVLAVVTVAPILHHGSTNYANVVGPLIGGVFAFAISRGYLRLMSAPAERERLVASLTRAHADLSQLQDELAIAQRHSGIIAERTRLSRDIHDTIAQGLSSIRLLAHAATSRTDDTDVARTLTQVETLAGHSLVDVRRIISALTPVELDDGALASALHQMLDRLRDESGVQTVLTVDDTLPTLPTEVEVALLRTAQSAVSNVRLHASASRITMSLIDADDTVRLDIIDDGAGFALGAWEPTPDATSSYGLWFMRDRLRELGGGLEVESTPGEGTAISAYLPIHVEEVPS